MDEEKTETNITETNTNDIKSKVKELMRNKKNVYLVAGLSAVVLLMLGILVFAVVKDNAESGPVEVEEGLLVEDVVEGTGAEVETGDMLTLHYVGTLEDGTKFDSSRDRNKEFEFRIGDGRVIEGWDRGLLGMKEGGTRILTIDSELGYGSQQVREIPPNSTLIFEVELLDVEKN